MAKAKGARDQRAACATASRLPWWRALRCSGRSRRTPDFIVRDAIGQALGHSIFEDEPERRAAAKLLTRDETRRIAANIAKLPGPLIK
jgi:hypothetical protein